MPEKESIRVIIVDDQAIVRSGLEAFINAYDELNLVGEASDGQEAIELCRMVQPDVVLMDLKMPVMDGISATRVIRELWPKVQVLVLTSFKEKEMVEGALDAGATGYLLKNITAKELVEAIRKVHAGRETVAQAASQTLVRAQLLEDFEKEIQGIQNQPAALPRLLQNRLGDILPHCRVAVRVFPNWDLIPIDEQDIDMLSDIVWRWLRTSTEAVSISPGGLHPWGGSQPSGSALVIAPILSQQNGKPIGGISIVQPGDPEELEELLPASRRLARAIAAVVTPETAGDASSRSYLNNELASAARMQADILPSQPPELRGWEIAARLESARETSGDFYDFIPLDNGKWGFVIADVTDKGMAAALFMALSSTLIRTYASQYPTLPALSLSTVNRRILSDTRGNMFVTVFFGVLEPDTGRLRYVNAGHNPPYLLSGQKGKPVDRLTGTGMALGVDENASWQQKIAKFSPGDVLVMYTDGVTDAQDPQGNFFGEHRLLSAVRNKAGCTAAEIRDAMLNEIDRFAGESGKHDDITVVVLRKL